jgi:hypothetical protein
MTDPPLHFRLLADALPDEERRIRSSYVPTLVLVIALSTVVFIAIGISKGASLRSMIQYGLIMVAYIACLAVLYPRRLRQRLIKCWETYDLEIGHDYLLRRQADIPDLRLQFDEVQAVEHVQGRYLRVIGQKVSSTLIKCWSPFPLFAPSACAPSSSGRSTVPSWRQDYSFS